MEPIEFSLDGKTYTVDPAKFTKAVKRKLGELDRQFKETGNIDAAYEAFEIVTGLPKKTLNELDIWTINEILAFIRKKIEEISRLQSH